MAFSLLPQGAIEKNGGEVQEAREESRACSLFQLQHLLRDPPQCPRMSLPGPGCRREVFEYFWILRAKRGQTRGWFRAQSSFPLSGGTHQLSPAVWDNRQTVKHVKGLGHHEEKEDTALERLPRTGFNALQPFIKLTGLKNTFQTLLSKNSS